LDLLKPSPCGYSAGRYLQVTLERLARLERVMLEEIEELRKLVNGE
jgi:hypothetical protein